MPISRIHSSNSQVFINGTRLTGVSQFEFSKNRDSENLQSLGSTHIANSITDLEPVVEISFSWILGKGVTDPFFDLSTGDIVSVEKFVLQKKDLAGTDVFSGQYLTSYEINGGVGDLVNGSATYEGDYHTQNTGVFTVESNDSIKPFLPSKIGISSTFAEGATTNLSAQNFSFSYPIPRKAVHQLGKRNAKLRYPELPTVGDFSFSVIKNEIVQMTGIVVLPTGDTNIVLEDCDGQNAVTYSLKGCRLENISESLDLDGSASIDFSYKFDYFTRS